MVSSALCAIYLQFTEESDKGTFTGSLENFLSVSSHSPIKFLGFKKNTLAGSYNTLYA